jgi:hypothetical protein
MKGRPANEVGRLIANVIWHLDRADVERDTFGNLLEARRHRDVVHELVTRIRTLDSSPAIAYVLREIMID